MLREHLTLEGGMIINALSITRVIYSAIIGEMVSQSINIFISDICQRRKFTKQQVTPKIWINTASHRKRSD